MKKIIFVISVIAVSIAMSVYLVFYFNFSLRGVKPVLSPPPQDIAKIIEEKGEGETVDFPLQLPDGFEISVFAKNLQGVRAMAFGQNGDLWVTQTQDGLVSALSVKDGKVVKNTVVLKGLRQPHGIAFDPQNQFVLYIAQENGISKLDLSSKKGLEKLVDLDSGGRHTTRTIKFGPDDRLYVSIGSSCDACREDNTQRGKIFSMNKDGSDFTEFARGLRNTVFFAWSEVDGRMWGADMGRDYLGDNVPSDEVNIIEKGKNYGWPICYGKNIHDTEFDKNTYIRNPCMEPFEQPSFVDLQAHSAPLGIAFVPEEGWPQEYWYNLLVAMHGSWNRKEPTGYKIVRVKLNDKGEYLGTEDFISGWLTAENLAYGRPVDIITQPGGIMYVSDDKAGVIYKITYTGKRSEALSDKNFEDCITAGNPVMESYPRQCRMDGKIYVEDVGNELEKTDLIRIDSPRPNEKIESPLEISGQARGTWFFEASFPISLFDENGELLGSAIATAKSDWMTEEFVPFEATLNFTVPATKKGKLFLKKDNPSGLSEHDDSLVVPVSF